MTPQPIRYIFRLNKSHEFPRGVRHYTGASIGTLYQTLTSAKNAVPGAVWVKRDRQNVWETANKDLIARERVHP